MKKLILPLLAILSVAAEAQVKEGRIVYERTMQLPTRVIRNAETEMQLPKSRTDQYELLFGNNQSVYQFLPNANDETPGSFSGNGIVMRFGGMNDIVYHNFETGTRVDQREFMDRSFVISDSVRPGKWKLTDETKTIFTYTARKAIGTNIISRPQVTMENGEMKRTMITDTVTVIAWFTTDIPVPVGPDMQGQLPGAILEMDINKGQVVYKALEVTPKVNVGKIKAPKDGKKVTPAEYTAERDKLMEEMRKNMPAGNVIRFGGN
jgi:GLPGLI family protein